METHQAIQTVCVIFIALILSDVAADEPATKVDQIRLLGTAPVIRLSGEGFQGQLPKATPEQLELAKSLRRFGQFLATDIGVRNLFKYQNLTKTTDWLDQALVKTGYEVERQSYEVDRLRCDNLIVQRKGEKSLTKSSSSEPTMTV